jgi:hypothetical protein
MVVGGGGGPRWLILGTVTDYPSIINYVVCMAGGGGGRVINYLWVCTVLMMVGWVSS